MTTKTQEFERNLRKDYDLKGNYEKSALPKHFEKPEVTRDRTFTSIHQQSTRDGMGPERAIRNDEAIQAKQIIDMNRYQTIRTAGRLGGNYENKEADLKDKVEKHAHNEMGFLQESASQEMYERFSKEDKKPLPEQEYTAVNLEPRKLKAD